MTKKLTDDEIDLFVKQAGETKALQIRQANVRVDAKILDKPRITDAQQALWIKQVEAGTRLKLQQANEQIDLTQRHEAEERALRQQQAVEEATLNVPASMVGTDGY